MNHPWLHVSLSTFPPTPVDTHVHEHSANNICTFFLDTTTGCKVFKLSMPASDLGLHHSLISSLGKLALFLSFLFLAPSLTPRFSVFPQKFSFSLWLLCLISFPYKRWKPNPNYFRRNVPGFLWLPAWLDPGAQTRTLNFLLKMKKTRLVVV